MAHNDFSAESPENYDQKCLCVLVLDVSLSMEGEPIKELNRGIQQFYDEVKNDTTSANRLEISIITFGNRVDTILDPCLVDNFTMPHLKANQSSTRLVDGVREGIATVEARKSWYKDTGQPYYRPWIILITDGQPDTDQDVNGLAQEIHFSTSDEQKKFIFYAVGVKGANMDILTKISSPQIKPAHLEGLKFTEFFKWLSASMAIVIGSKDGDKVNFPSADNWMEGFTIS